MADQEDPASQRNPDWEWDEEILAFDVYLRFGAIGREHPEVHELSDVLRRLPLHPVEERTPTFRNPNGVSRKLADIQTHEPGYIGKPTSGSRLDEEVWAVYGNERQAVHNLAAVIRSGMGTVTAEEDDEAEVDAAHREGRIVYRLHRKRERDPKLRRRKMNEVSRRYGHLVCEACGADLEAIYGPLGAVVFECHHLVPLHVTGETITMLSDVVLLCPTCHRVTHRVDPWPTLEQLRHLARYEGRGREPEPSGG